MPESFNNFMAEFVTELKELTLNGIKINGKQTSIIVDGLHLLLPQCCMSIPLIPTMGVVNVAYMEKF